MSVLISVPRPYQVTSILTSYTDILGVDVIRTDVLTPLSWGKEVGTRSLMGFFFYQTAGAGP